MSSWSDFLRRSVLGRQSIDGSTLTTARSRVPFKFTSDLCLSELEQGSLDNALARNNGAPGPLGFGAVTTQNIAGTNANSGVRIDKLASDAAVARFGIIAMSINPQSIRWTQAKRFVKRDTMNGSTFMHFLSDTKQDNDIPRIEFTGVSGNISLKGSGLPFGGDVTNDTRGFEKLLRFHQLWNLTRQPKLFVDRSLGLWVENKQYIIYETQVLPFPVLLTGFYDTVLEFEENAEKANQVHYKFSFIVQSTSPSIDDIAAAIADAEIPLAPTTPGGSGGGAI